MGNRNRTGAGRRRLIVATLALWAVPQIALAQCSDDVVHLRGDWGSARFSVEVADDSAERARGLMYVEHLPAGHGMLFIYPAPHRAGFWMKNTLIPLDMIFVDGGGTVTHVHENAIPHDATVIDGGEGVVAVLELNGGMAARIGIGVGDQLRHPAFGDAGVWPCDAG